MFEAVFPFSSIPAEEVARLCLTQVGAEAQHELRLYRSAVKERAMYREIRRRQHFDIEIAGLRLGWGGVRNHGLAFLTTQGTSKAVNTTLLRSLITKMPLVTARFYNDEYEHWQNAEDPLEYTAVGRSMEGLPMKSNDLPPPLDQMIVDISGNPGRRILRNGYVEAVGHKMWLGPEFFRRVPRASREAVLSAPWLKVFEQAGGILELVAQEEPFVDDTTTDLQDRLRRLLFPTMADER